MPYEMDDIRQRCVALSYPGRHGGGGHLSSRGLCIEQGARVVRMDKKGGGWGWVESRGSGVLSIKREMANDIGGRRREPSPTMMSSGAHPDAEVEGQSWKKKKRERKFVYSREKFSLDVTLL